MSLFLRPNNKPLKTGSIPLDPNLVFQKTYVLEDTFYIIRSHANGLSFNFNKIYESENGGETWTTTTCVSPQEILLDIGHVVDTNLNPRIVVLTRELSLLPINYNVTKFRAYYLSDLKNSAANGTIPNPIYESEPSATLFQAPLRLFNGAIQERWTSGPFNGRVKPAGIIFYENYIAPGDNSVFFSWNNLDIPSAPKGRVVNSQYEPNYLTNSYVVTIFPASLSGGYVGPQYQGLTLASFVNTSGAIESIRTFFTASDAISTLCEAENLIYTTQQTAAMFNSSGTILKRALKISPTQIQLSSIPTNTGLTAQQISSAKCKITEDGKMWIRSGTVRKFSPNFGGEWIDLPSVSGTQSGNWSISANGKNQIFTDSQTFGSGFTISTNYGY